MLLVFLALVIAAGGLGWTENGNDYSRYLAASTDNKRIVLAVALGAAVPSALLEILGAAVGTAVPAAANSPTGLVAGFSTWFVVPFLIFAIVQLFAINTLDLYSSGVTLQSLIPRLKRLHCVAIDTVVCAAFTAYAVFSSSFFGLLTGFLLYIILWLAPWCAIYLVDSLLRRNRYDHDGLLDESGGRYFRGGGIHWPAIIAQVAGGVAAYLWLNASSGGVLASSRPAVQQGRRLGLQRLHRAAGRRARLLAAGPRRVTAEGDGDSGGKVSKERQKARRWRRGRPPR